jgi:hypothetical protein
MGEKYPALRYSDTLFKECKNGVWTVECSSWKEFENRIMEFKEKKFKYLWRGQSCDQPLLPSIYRDGKPDNKRIEKHLRQFRKDVTWAADLEDFLKRAKKERTKEFEKALSEYYKMVQPKPDADDPKENYEEDFINDIYWAIGQHHGLKTPLLDWTMDPYKALFFAFCDREKKNDKRVVFGLAEKSRRLLHKEGQVKRYIELLTNLGFVKTILSGFDSLPDFKERIRSMFRRIEAQDGVFTHSLHIEDVEVHAKRCYPIHKERGEGEIVFLIKILFPDSIRESILRELDKKRITYKTMYPDFQGAALHCNMKFCIS